MNKINQDFDASDRNIFLKRSWVWIFILFMMLTGAIVYYTFFRAETPPVSVVTGNFLPDGKDANKMTDKEIQKYAQQAVDQNQFNMRIVSNAEVDVKTMKSGIAIQNPPSNRFPVNVVITDNQTGVELYSSGAIQPGEEIKEAILDQSLDSGRHNVTATFKLYDPITKKQKGQLQSGLTLTVS